MECNDLIVVSARLSRNNKKLGAALYVETSIKNFNIFVRYLVQISDIRGSFDYELAQRASYERSSSNSDVKWLSRFLC